MLQIRVMPCLLLDNGALVKTIKFKKPSYIGDPINAIKIYNEKEVDELILLDITATEKKSSPNYKKISEVATECFMPFTYGGGIKSIEEIKKLFELGVEKVSINSAAINNPALIQQAAEKFGNQSIVVSIDVQKNIWGKYQVYTKRGKRSIGIDPVTYAKKMEKLGAGELLINAIHKDGTWEGYDIELLKSISQYISIPIIACGGASSIEDFSKAVKEGGASAVAAGSMVVYQKKGMGVLINFPDRKSLESALN